MPVNRFLGRSATQLGVVWWLGAFSWAASPSAAFGRTVRQVIGPKGDLPLLQYEKPIESQLLRRAETLKTTVTTATTGLPHPWRSDGEHRGQIAWKVHQVGETTTEDALSSNPATLLERGHDWQLRQRRSHVNGGTGFAAQRTGLLRHQRREIIDRGKSGMNVGMSDITVWCGGHHASECAACPLEHGALWCNGDCEWKESFCTFRQDLVWCGEHAAQSCAECIGEAPELEWSARCNGECSIFNGTCMSTLKATQLQQSIASLAPETSSTGSTSSGSAPSTAPSSAPGAAPGSASGGTPDSAVGSGSGGSLGEAPEYGGLPMPSTTFYLKPQHNPLHHQVFMSFYDFGCCRMQEEDYAGTDMGPMAADDCMRLCLLSDVCIAADIGGPKEGSLFTGPGGAPAFGCRMYSGKGLGFHTACVPSFHCYRKVVPGTTQERSKTSTRSPGEMQKKSDSKPLSA